MAKEKSEYRDILEDASEYFGGKRLLSVADVAKYLKVDRRTVVERFGISKMGITLPALARRLSEL